MWSGVGDGFGQYAIMPVAPKDLTAVSSGAVWAGHWQLDGRCVGPDEAYFVARNTVSPQ